MPLMQPVTFSLHSALTRWQWSPFSMAVLAALVVVAYWYLRADWILASRGRRWPAKRTLPFLGGLLAIDVALQSPVAVFTQSYFEAHITQHLLLMIVAPPLLAFGAPSTLLLQTAGPAVKKRWLAVLRSRSFSLLTHPVTVWILYFGVMFWFFLTSAVNTAMHDMALMDAINVVFLLGGTLYWWPLIDIDPIVHWKMGHGAKMANVLIGAAPETFIGVTILLQNHPIASMYTLSSTHAGGGLLWTSTEFATVGAFVPIFVQWMRSEERAAERTDRRLDRARMALAAAASTQAPEGPVDTPVVATSTTGSSRLRPDRAAAWEAAWLAKAGTVPAEVFGESTGPD